MNFLLSSFISVVLLTGITWGTDIEKAEKAAKDQHEYILLNFSGSDWCGPCIRLHKDYFDSPAFTDYAAGHLQLVNADFPRLKKNQLSKAQQNKNDQAADQYNKEGSFPLTLLLNADGKLIKRWEGVPDISPEAFTAQIKEAIDANDK